MEDAMHALSYARRRRPANRLRAALLWLVIALERQRTRRALARLGDEQLRDIGLTRAEAQAESARPFWQ
jgi:uncharacterized protein YjiS (DUF1127 family)